MKNFNNILIVDDDNANNFITQRVLIKSGASNNIAIANNGQEGLDYLSKHQPDLIFLDLNMPVMNGFEFIQNIYGSEIINKCKIVILTTSSESKDLARIRNFGVKDYILKPLTIQKLEDIFG